MNHSSWLIFFLQSSPKAEVHLKSRYH